MPVSVRLKCAVFVECVAADCCRSFVSMWCRMPTLTYIICHSVFEYRRSSAVRLLHRSMGSCAVQPWACAQHKCCFLVVLPACYHLRRHDHDGALITHLTFPAFCVQLEGTEDGALLLFVRNYHQLVPLLEEPHPTIGIERSSGLDFNTTHVNMLALLSQVDGVAGNHSCCMML